MFATNGKHQIRGKRDGSVWQIGKCKQEFHETQKPIELIEKIIGHSTDEGMVVFDPFMGSGTTAKMAMLNNRNYIGSEISKEYCEIAEQRLKMCGGLFFKFFSNGIVKRSRNVAACL